MIKEKEIVEFIQPTPKPKSKKCAFLINIVAFLLRFSALLVMIGVFFLFNWNFMYAITSFFLSYIVVGIIRAKMRQLAIPPQQLELNYNDKAIAAWYLLKFYCFEEHI